MQVGSADADAMHTQQEMSLSRSGTLRILIPEETRLFTYQYSHQSFVSAICQIYFLQQGRTTNTSFPEPVRT
jgi:hypothetical protein